MNMMLEPIQISYKIILMSHYTFTLPSEVYRWMVADQLIPNRGITTLTQANSMKRGSLPSPPIKTLPWKTDSLLRA